MRSYVQRNGWKRAIATALALVIMFDLVWDGKAGEGCKSMLAPAVAVR